jgi:hypothetical protein
MNATCAETPTWFDAAFPLPYTVWSATPLCIHLPLPLAHIHVQ